MGKKIESRRRRRKAHAAQPQESASYKAEQLTRIIHALDVRDMDTLRLISSRHGINNNALRMRAWPLFLQADLQPQEPQKAQGEFHHRDVHVVEVDCERSLWHRQVKDEERPILRQRLKEVINSTITKSDDGYYYQGLNDIASALILLEFSVASSNCPVHDSLAFSCLSSLVGNHLRDFTRSTMEPTIEVLQLISPLLRLLDPELHKALDRTGCLKDCFFALPWLITWFTHEVKSIHTAFRLLDLCLSSHPLMSLYLGAVVMSSKLRAKLMGCAEMHEAHVVLSHVCLDPSEGGLVSHREDLEALIAKSLDLFDEIPISRLLDSLSSRGKCERPLINCVSPWSSIVDGCWQVSTENKWHLCKKGGQLRGELQWSKAASMLSKGMLLTVSTLSLGFLLVAFSATMQDPR